MFYACNSWGWCVSYKIITVIITIKSCLKGFNYYYLKQPPVKLQIWTYIWICTKEVLPVRSIVSLYLYRYFGREGFQGIGDWTEAYALSCITTSETLSHQISQSGLEHVMLCWPTDVSHMPAHSHFSKQMIL